LVEETRASSQSLLAARTMHFGPSGMYFYTMSGVPPDDGRREAEDETQNSLGLVEGTSQGEESPI